jgi:hypothetical protein
MNTRFAYKTACSLLLVLLLSACTLQLIYPRLPFLVSWQIDNYLELSDEQEDWLDERLRKHLATHRENELPRYVAFSKKIQQTLNVETIDEQILIDLGLESKQLYVDLMHQFIDDAVELINGLSDEQVQRLVQKQKEETAEDDKEFASSNVEERAEQRLENTLDDLTELVGRLSKDQKQLVKSFVEQRSESYLLAKPTQARWDQLVADALQKRHDKVYLREQLLLIFEQPESLRDPAYHAVYDRNGQLRRQMQVALFATLNTKQRAHLQKEIGQWHEDFSELIAAR